jgi:DNA-binding beta-propeller fold protein YncE
MNSENRLACVNALAACAFFFLSASSFGPVPRFGYVANSKDNTVSIYTVDAITGQFRDSSYVLSGAAPLGLAVTASGKFVFVANSGSNNVSAFKVNTTNGGLTSVSGSPFIAHTTPAAITVDPAGKFVFVANKSRTRGQPRGTSAPVKSYPILDRGERALEMSNLGRKSAYDGPARFSDDDSCGTKYTWTLL